MNRLKDRYCACGKLCVWVFSEDNPPRGVKAYFAMCPSCHHKVHTYCEQDDYRAEVLTPNRSFQIYLINETLKERIAELESALCETCKDPACEDSVIEHLKQKVARLEKENKKFREILIAKNARCPACDKWERAREFLGLPWKQYPDELKKIFEESAE